MVVDGNVNNLVNTIAHQQAFREITKAILSGNKTQPSSSLNPATVQTDNRRTNVTRPIGSSICNSDRNQPIWQSCPKTFKNI